MAIQIISPTEVYGLQQESGGVILLDVRECDEFAELNSPLALNFPLSLFQVEDVIKKFAFHRPIYVICRSGKRSLKAAQLLESAGYGVVYNVVGGMLEWVAAGLPCVGDFVKTSE